jgi:deoxyribodipyrimidine photolyase
MSIISQLKPTLHSCLLSRIHHVNPPPPVSTSSRDKDGFVLYLPTVSLRMDQNPAFALACHAANLRNVPLVVLAVVLDNAHHNKNTGGSTVMTSRRLAFTLQALSHACSSWSAHGAAVGIRIHAPSNASHKLVGARTPDHLTLASRAAFVVTDEPFVFPYLNMVQRVEEACRKSNVECVRVDGSCTVPPLQILKRTRNNAGVLFEGVPDKAYLWQKKTEGFRMAQLNAALNGEFDAPKLIVRMKDEELCIPLTKTSDEPTDVLSWGQRLAHVFPSRWKTVLDADGNSILPNAPDVRPFTSKELFHLYQYDDFSFDDVASTTNKQTHHEHASESLQKCDDDLNLPKTATTTPFHNFALNWPGADSSVPPVTHTIGTASHGMDRWNDFVQNGGLSRYAKERNDARNNLKGVSRMSAFLNLGIVSIFRLVWEMK